MTLSMFYFRSDVHNTILYLGGTVLEYSEFAHIKNFRFRGSEKEKDESLHVHLAGQNRPTIRYGTVPQRYCT